MPTELYIEALLVDEDAADAIWEVWDAGETSDFSAAWVWWRVVLTRDSETHDGRTIIGYLDD